VALLPSSGGGGRSTGARARLRQEGLIWASLARSGPCGPDHGRGSCGMVPRIVRVVQRLRLGLTAGDMGFLVPRCCILLSCVGDEWCRVVPGGVSAVETGAAGKLWWLAGFPGLVGETTGESRTSTALGLSMVAPAGVVSLLEALMEHSSPTFPTSSRVHPRSGLPVWR
jgi:hypothetical protein